MGSMSGLPPAKDCTFEFKFCCPSRAMLIPNHWSRDVMGKHPASNVQYQTENVLFFPKSSTLAPPYLPILRRSSKSFKDVTWSCWTCKLISPRVKHLTNVCFQQVPQPWFIILVYSVTTNSNREADIPNTSTVGCDVNISDEDRTRLFVKFATGSP